MKRFPSIAGALVSALFIFCSCSFAPSDEEIRSTLVGDWTVSTYIKDIGNEIYRYSFRSDGSFEVELQKSESFFRSVAGGVNLATGQAVATGDWKVTNGILTYRLTGNKSPFASLITKFLDTVLRGEQIVSTKVDRLNNRNVKLANGLELRR